MKAEDNEYPHITVKEGTVPSNPVSGDQALYIDSADHKLKRVNSSGAVTAIETTPASFVGARYTTNTAQAVTNTPTIINFEDIDYDPGTIVTTGASWHITIPSTGYYHITAIVTLASASWAVTNDMTMYLYVGGASAGAIGRLTGVSGTILNDVIGSCTRHFTASDSVDIRITQNAQASINTYNSGDFNHISIEKVG